jgi:hypothetical protein
MTSVAGGWDLGGGSRGLLRGLATRADLGPAGALMCGVHVLGGPWGVDRCAVLAW